MVRPDSPGRGGEFLAGFECVDRIAPLDVFFTHPPVPSKTLSLQCGRWIICSERIKKAKRSGPSASEVFGSEFLSAEDVKRSFETTMHDIDSQDFENDDGKSRTVWYFVDDEDRCIKINKTNGRKIAEAFGDDMSQWSGSRVRVSRHKYSIGWGFILEPIADDDEEVEEVEDDVPFDDEEEEEEEEDV